MSRAEPARVRELGTVVHVPTSGEERIAAFRSIIEARQYAKIDGAMVDLFTASAVVRVFDALSEANRATFSAMPAPRMAAVAFKLLR